MSVDQPPVGPVPPQLPEPRGASDRETDRPTDLGLFGPASTTWRLHADPLLGVAGLRALLLQAVHPVAMRGVADHSRYREQPWDRLVTTADYVGVTTFGSTAEALQAAARVRAVHARIRGWDPHTGTEYRADDEDLLLWVHCALADSVLDVLARGGVRLPRAEADRYLAEQVRSATLVGLEPDGVPASTAELADYFEAVQPHLAVGRAAREVATYVIAPPMRPVVALATPARPVWAAMAGLAYASLPTWARRLYALPELPGAAGLTDAATGWALRALRAALSGVQMAAPPLVEGPHQRRARERLSRPAPADGQPAPTGPVQDVVIDLAAAERAAQDTGAGQV